MFRAGTQLLGNSSDLPGLASCLRALSSDCRWTLDGPPCQPPVAERPRGISFKLKMHSAVRLLAGAPVGGVGRSRRHQDAFDLTGLDLAPWPGTSRPLTSGVRASRGAMQHDQPGGGRVQLVNPATHSNQPAAVKLHQMAATVSAYRQQSIKDGIPNRLSALQRSH